MLTYSDADCIIIYFIMSYVNFYSDVTRIFGKKNVVALYSNMKMLFNVMKLQCNLIKQINENVISITSIPINAMQINNINTNAISITSMLINTIQINNMNTNKISMT